MLILSTAFLKSMTRIFQKILPKHSLSRLIGRFCKSEIVFLKNFLISTFCLFYKVDFSEAKKKKEEYKTFNDFFTRELKPNCRPISSGLCFPCDGLVADCGDIDKNPKIHAKGHCFSIVDLVGADSLDHFSKGSHLTVYLAPSDYHRVHMPSNGRLTNATYIPGDLFSVNPKTVSEIPGLYAKNERLVFNFRTDQGNMIIVMVGAAIVAGIKPFWREAAFEPRIYKKEKVNFCLKKGDEIGLFEMGSTVILLLSNRFEFNLKKSEKVFYGQSIS